MGVKPIVTLQFQIFLLQNELPPPTVFNFVVGS